MLARIRFRAPAACPLAALADPRLLAAGVAWSAAALAAFGLGSAIIPNAAFGRQIPPEPFAIWTWVLSAPLIGLVMATYTVPMSRPIATPIPALESVTLRKVDAGARPRSDARSSRLGMIGSVGAFLAIGCPVCNKIALVLLGTSGALSIWAPLQPWVAAASIVLLVATLAWRLRIRAMGGACPA